MRRELLPLAGAIVLAAFSVAALPFSRGLFHFSPMPYDARVVLLQSAQPLIPRNASVLVRSEPPDATEDSYLHRFAVALLPGRRIIPAALWSIPAPPELVREAEYEIVVGRRPSPPPGRLLLEIPEGTVWRREP